MDSVLAGESLPRSLTTGPDCLPDARPRHLVFPQDIDCPLQLVLGLSKPRRIDAQLVEQHFRHLAVGPDREVALLRIRLENLAAKLHALVADEDARTRDKPPDLVLAFPTKGAAPRTALAGIDRIPSSKHRLHVRIP